MFARALPVLTLCLLSLPVWAQSTDATAPVAAPAGAPAPDEAAPVVQTVLVSGARPGPGLWKVSKGEHVMWVFGTYSPLPAKMEWRSRAVEKAIAASQEYIKPPLAKVGVGWMGGIAALPFMVGIKNNPNGELKDVLPPDVYARWQPLKQTYFGDDTSIERQRPAFVAAELASRVFKKAGLTPGDEVDKTIGKLVDKYKLKVTDPTVTVQIKEPGKAARDFKKSAMDDVPCLAKSIERLEGDLNLMRERANAWAVGELGEIRKLNYEAREACTQALTSSSLAKNQPELQTLRERAQASWVVAAEKALAANGSTFAMVHIREILDPKGVIATLQSKGYTVEPPK